MEQIVVDGGTVTGVRLQGGETINADIVISNADMWHTETRLLDPKWHTHPQSYWDKRTMAPSAFIMYLGVSEKLPKLIQHNLLFS